MSVTVWGELAKAQDDDQTIAEAIAAAIVAHEADETAHLGEGESLQSHRASEIIDHARASIVGDKLAANDFWFETMFEVAGTWTQVGDTDIGGWGAAVLRASDGESSTSGIHGTVPGTIPLLHMDRQFVYQTVFYVEKGGAGTVNIGVGTQGATIGNKSAGIYFDGSDWKAYYKNTGSVSYSDAITVSDEVTHILRIECDPENLELVYYLDGLEVARIAYAASTDWLLTDVYYYATNSDGEYDVSISKLSIYYPNQALV